MRRPRGEPPRRLAVEAAAKINIGWRVGEARPDGYHEVRGLLQTISLTDRLEITVGSVQGQVVVGQVGLTVTGPEATDDLLATDNLVLRAAAVLGGGRPTSIVLYKRIPVAAGLGGGSADAAAALVGLSMAWRGRAAGHQLLEAAALLGSDVPGILVGGLVAVGGRGEDVRSVGSGSGYRMVVGMPDGRLSAAEVYARFDEVGGGDGRQLHHNDLEAAVVSLCPGILAGLGAMRYAGADPVFVSGSGPAVVGVCGAREAEVVAERVRSGFRAVRVVEPVGWGVRLAMSS